MSLSVKDVFGEDFEKSNPNVISNLTDSVADAKKSVKSLMAKNEVPMDFTNLLDNDNLAEVENGIRQMNEFADKCWLLSSIMIYTLIYDKNMYEQSGLNWLEYVAQSKERLGIEPTDFSMCLCTAKFFIKYHRDLVKAGWNPVGSRRKLARAELALALSGDLNATINHLVNDSWRDFFAWYSEIKNPEKYIGTNKPVETVRKDIKITKKGKITVGGVVPVTIADELSPEDKSRLQDLILQYFECLQTGDYPALIPTYDEREASSLVSMRDKRRQSK